MSATAKVETWQSPHPDDFGDWFVGCKLRLHQPEARREGYPAGTVNVILARCEDEDNARQIARALNAHDALVADVDRLHRDRNALIGALRRTARRLDAADDGLCWCPHLRLNAEAHVPSCLDARAALARVEPTR